MNANIIYTIFFFILPQKLFKLFCIHRFIFYDCNFYHIFSPFFLPVYLLQFTVRRSCKHVDSLALMISSPTNVL